MCIFENEQHRMKTGSCECPSQAASTLRSVIKLFSRGKYCLISDSPIKYNNAWWYTKHSSYKHSHPTQNEKNE